MAEAAATAARQISAPREFGPALAFVAAVLWCAQPGAGFMLPLLVPFALVWFIRMGFLAWRRPPRRRAQAIKLGLIVAALLVTGLAHGHHERRTREEAQKVVDVVTAYRTAHGAYPDDLGQAGLDAQALRHDWRIYYLNVDGRHSVMYSATFTVFDRYYQDLDKPAGWVFRAD